MTTEQAKVILSSFRHGSEDERDPSFAEALRQAQQDPELAAWLKEQESLDTTIRRKLQTSSLPPDLLADIRAGVSVRRSGWRQNVLPALAACLVLCATLALVWFGRKNPQDSSLFAACRADMVRYLAQFPELDLETERLSEASQWLADTHHLQQVQIPTGLERFPTIGCRTLDWRGQKLALVCFMVDGEVVHLILIPKTAVPDGPGNLEPQYVQVAGTSTVSWSKGDLTYLVLSKAGKKFLQGRI